VTLVIKALNSQTARVCNSTSFGALSRSKPGIRDSLLHSGGKQYNLQGI